MKLGEKFFLIGVIFLLGIFFYGCITPPEGKDIPRFSSCEELKGAFKESYSVGRYGAVYETLAVGAPSAEKADYGTEYSETNIQVQGVDEADIVKTDGKYIYTLSHGNLTISDAFPAENARVLTIKDIGDVQAQEMFIHGNNVLIFGSKQEQIYKEKVSGVAKDIYVPPSQIMVVQIWNTSNKENPTLERSAEFEGRYLSSRKINEKVYFVVNSYPNYHIMAEITNGTAVKDEKLVPRFKDEKKLEKKEFEPICGCTEVGYFEPVQAQSFVTIASIDMANPNSEIQKETVVGTGENVYASLNNLYLAEVQYHYGPIETVARTVGVGDSGEKTIVHKFSLSNGQIGYQGKMEVPGRILNQFSMDEFEGNFRIATTQGHVSRTGGGSTNNVYIFGSDLQMRGKLEGLAPGERIYSARFMGNKAYLVTFKKVDPLFVIDVSDPNNPRVLGKLKIPGYSDYLHPIDETHLIGIGKETVEAEEGDFAWYQGVKIAIFDVSDVENPIELFKEEIGDRGTDSFVLRDHKAFLFDKEKELMVLPITLAEHKVPPSEPWQTGEYTFQGAYVYRINLSEGLQLRGRITHHEEGDLTKLGSYYYGSGNAVKRSLYIENVLYTISDNKIKANSLSDLSEIKELTIGEGNDYSGVYI